MRRRKFLLQTGMAATAVIASNPFKVFASLTPTLTEFSGEKTSVLLMHTAHTASHLTVKNITELKNRNANAVLLSAAYCNPLQFKEVKYDVAAAENNLSFINHYTIIYKGNIRIGVIKDIREVNEINSIAAKLKKEKNCHLVIYLSNLGYKNKNTIDDVTLAEKSVNLDIIIGGHAENFSQHSMIVLNASGEEVMINHALGKPADLGKIEIDLDSKGYKKRIDFHNRVAV